MAQFATTIGVDMTNNGVRMTYLVNILLYALVMGVFWGTWFSLSRSISSIAPDVFLDIGHTMIANLARPMSLLMPVALISSVLLLIVLARQRRDAVFFLALTSFVLMIAALAITLPSTSRLITTSVVGHRVASPRTGGPHATDGRSITRFGRSPRWPHWDAQSRAHCSGSHPRVASQT